MGEIRDLKPLLHLQQNIKHLACNSCKSFRAVVHNYVHVQNYALLILLGLVCLIF